jgi:hypothetical protein
VAIGKGKGVTETAKDDPAATEIKALWHELNDIKPIIAAKPKSKAKERSS